MHIFFFFFFFFKQKTAYEMSIGDWSSDVCSSDLIGAVAGSVSRAEQTAAAVADGPDDGPGLGPSDVVDVDENGIDTTAPGYTIGQRVTWWCGSGGTAACPSVTIHDASTAISTDPEFPFVLGTIQGHRTGTRGPSRWPSRRRGWS